MRTMFGKPMSTVRSDLDQHAAEIRSSIDDAADTVSLALVVIGSIAVAALLIALLNDPKRWPA